MIPKVSLDTDYGDENVIAFIVRREGTSKARPESAVHATYCMYCPQREGVPYRLEGNIVVDVSAHYIPPPLKVRHGNESP
jgi:hypothetical protein